MCLSKVISDEPLVAKEDITVYKVVYKYRGEYRSPYQDFKYRIGRPYISTLRAYRAIQDNTGKWTYYVEEGLHTFVTLDAAREAILSHPESYQPDYAILECVIPKDALYYMGRFDTVFCTSESAKLGGLPSCASAELHVIKEIPVQS